MVMDNTELINELEQIEAIASASGVLALDRLTVLEKYVRTRLRQLKQTSIKERGDSDD